MNDKRSVRREAVSLYLDIVQDGAYANLRLQKYARHAADAREVRFMYELILGVLDKKIYLEYIIGQYARAKKLRPVMAAILLLGAYQIIYMERVPDSAVCNESVAIAREMGLAQLSGFVNGVLRTISREKERLPGPDKASDAIGYLATMGSWPRWVVERWDKAYGIELAEQLALFETPRITVVRRNALRVTQAQWDAYCLEHGVSYTRGVWESEALYARGLRDIEHDAAFRDGWYSVQGESAMLAVRAAMPAGAKILDACGAPGGKACCLAEWTNDGADILCFDVHPHRTELIRQTAQRLGLSSLRVEVQDASARREALIGRFDTVMIDAPCTGLGVFGKPDVKLNRSEADMLSLCALQSAILDACCAYTRVGGMLVYSTCTTLVEENTAQIEAFLSRHDEFAAISLAELVPTGVANACDQYGALRLLPPLHGIEGFYIAKLRRMR